jgi:beta-lactamase regulating signal transducer with metallopeptidase domain
MNQLQIFFNLLFNGTTSFVAGLLIVLAAIRLFHIGTSRWKFALLTLPFLKVISDIFAGVPSTSVLYHAINPLEVPPRAKTLTIGLGLEHYHPVVNIVFSVFDAARKQYSVSVADFVWFLMKRVWAGLPVFCLLAALAVSFVLVCLRIRELWAFETERKRNFADPALTSAGELRPAGLRRVRIAVSEAYSGTPFTGGLLHPYICLPADSEKLLLPEEKDAVIQHEMAHVRHFDLPVGVAIQLLGDVFWFIPGYRYLQRKLDRLREVLADDRALRSGASSSHLASALLKVQETEMGAPAGVLYSALFKDRSLLKQRVERLLGEETGETAPRFGWGRKIPRAAIAALILLTVLSAHVGGNWEVTPFPDWLSHFLDNYGIHVN